MQNNSNKSNFSIDYTGGPPSPAYELMYADEFDGAAVNTDNAI